MFNDGDSNRGVFAEFISARETGRSSSDNNDVSVGVSDHVGHVAAGHLPGDDGLPDGVEFELVQIVGRLSGGGGDGEGGCSGGGFETERRSREQRGAMEGGFEQGGPVKLGG